VGRRRVHAFWASAQHHIDANLAAAKLILRAPQLYGGESAGLVHWARLTMARVPARRCAAA
jgi:hypothetical protein